MELALSLFTAPGGLARSPDSIVAAIKEARETVLSIQAEVMKPGVHYGLIPGTPKVTLLKEGADVLNMAFQITPRQLGVDDESTGEISCFTVRVGLFSRDGVLLGEGSGTCSSGEEKYRWQKANKAAWDATASHRRRELKGERDGRTWSTLQVQTDPWTMRNTCLQMAAKRALVQATRTVHAVSDIFADITLEDLPEDLRDQLLLGSGKTGKKVMKPVERKPAPSNEAKPANGNGNGNGGANGGAAKKEGGAPAEGETTPTGGAERLAVGPISAEQWQAAGADWHNNGAISEAQVKRLFAVAKSSGWSAGDVRSLVTGNLDTDIEAIPFGKPYAAIVAIFETNQAPQE